MLKVNKNKSTINIIEIHILKQIITWKIWSWRDARRISLESSCRCLQIFFLQSLCSKPPNNSTASMELLVDNVNNLFPLSVAKELITERRSLESWHVTRQGHFWFNAVAIHSIGRIMFVVMTSSNLSVSSDVNKQFLRGITAFPIWTLSCVTVYALVGV